MQKFIARLFVIIFSFSFFVPILPTKAYDITVDQQNTTISQAAVVIYNYGHNQTFTPTKDVLTSVQVYLKDRRAGANITLTVKDETAGETVLQVNQRMDGGTGWEVFDFTGGDPLGYVLTPGNLHSIWIETAYYTTEPIPKWVRTGNDTYTGGTRRQNSTAYSEDDFPFATFGYSLDQGGGEEPAVVPTPDEDTNTVDQTVTETTTEDQVTTENESANEEDTTNAEETATAEDIVIAEDLVKALEADDEGNGTGTLTQIILFVLASLLAFLLLFGFAYLVLRDEMIEFYEKYFSKSKNGTKKPTTTVKATT